jgi:hypothetical protein
MNEKDVWMISDMGARMISPSFVIKEKLPVSVYNVNLVPFTGWVLEPYAKKFTFDYKLYDLQNEFIDHVCKTYNSTTGNLGILLNGTKGTGKTVTAKELANKLNLPVIIVKSFGERNQDLIEYLSSINSDCILFFDEFEKNFNENDSTILQIMDGVYNSGNRKVFLLTTNTMTINDNLIGRPSRIRYVKTFGNLELKVVKSYLDDNLEDKSCYGEVIEFIDSLTISTIDILKTVVNEINIHGIEKFRKTKEFFNVKSTKYNYQIYVSDVNIQLFSLDKESNPRKYSVENFLEHLKYKKKFEEVRLHYIDYKEFEDARDSYEEFRRNSPFGNFQFNQFESNCKFASLHEGDTTEYGTVLHIDHERNVIITYDNNDGEYEEIHFIYCINPNTKPSLYSNYKVY